MVSSNVVTVAIPCGTVVVVINGAAVFLQNLLDLRDDLRDAVHQEHKTKT